MATISSIVAQIVAQILVLAIKCYQWGLSPLLAPRRCRFFPSCSEYAITCLQQDRLDRALQKIVRRLLSCHPFHPGGVDLP